MFRQPNNEQMKDIADGIFVICELSPNSAYHTMRDKIRRHQYGQGSLLTTNDFLDLREILHTTAPLVRPTGWGAPCIELIQLHYRAGCAVNDVLHERGISYDEDPRGEQSRGKPQSESSPLSIIGLVALLFIILTGALTNQPTASNPYAINDYRNNATE